MPKITGRLTDFGLDALAEHNPRVVFRHSAPGIAGVSLLTTRPVETVTAYNGYFEAELVASARVSPAGFYTVTIEWTEPPSRKILREVFPGKLYVPAEGGALADCLRVPANPGLVYSGEEPPADPSPGSWWLDTDGRIQEFGQTGWNFKQNIRGPAGKDATGAAEDDAAIAAFVAGKTKTAAAVRAAVGPDAVALAARPAPSRPPRPLVVFTFDDGWTRDMSEVKPILDAAAVKATFCIIADKPGSSASRLTWEQVRQLEAEGHEIANHSMTHASLGDSTDPALIDREVKESQTVFIKNGLEPTGFCWAGQRSTPAARAAARGIFRYALGGTGARKQPFGTYEIRRETLNAKSDMRHTLALVDAAKANNEMLVFLTHSTPEELGTTGLANLRTVIGYVKAAGVEITTAGRAFQTVGNLFDSEGTVIDGAGHIYSVTAEGAGPLARAEWGGYNQTAALPPSAYPEGAITHSTTTNAANTDWPEKGAGNIITNRANGTNYLFALQEYYGVSGTVYRRRGASLTKWGSWKSSTHNVTAGAKTYASDLPSSYPLGTTLQPVTGSGVPDTPGGVPGLLITHRAGPRFCVQEFQVDNGGPLYRRTVSAADEWLPFKRLTTT